VHVTGDLLEKNQPPTSETLSSFIIYVKSRVKQTAMENGEDI
jgi:hypothetical protein